MTTETQVPVDETGAAVLDLCRDYVARFCNFPNQASLDTVTLWIAHTHVLDGNEHLAYETSPRIAFLSDEPASGKTRALEMCEKLGHRGEMVIDPTPASFAIAVAEKRQTVLIDEIDILFGGGSAKSVLRSLLNSGYKSGAVWSRANKDDLSVFAPVGLAGLASKFRTAAALSTLRSRSIMIPMRPTRKAEPYRARLHDATSDALRHHLAAWASRNVGRITEDWPTMPDGVEDRMAEVWEPLLMLADVAGGHWPESAAAACRELALGDAQDAPEIPLVSQLLGDLRTAFGAEPKMSTVRIVEKLYGIPDAPWLTLWPHAGSAPRELAALLGPLGVAPTKVREGQQSLRGYKREDLQPLWRDVPERQGPDLRCSAVPDDDEGDQS